jgi:lipid-binding SYLF domain-containing protein
MENSGGSKRSFFAQVQDDQSSERELRGAFPLTKPLQQQTSTFPVDRIINSDLVCEIDRARKEDTVMQLKRKFFVTVTILIISACNSASAQDLKEGTEQSQKAATVFKEIMGVPDKAIPKKIVDGAECIGVFPQVIKAGFVIGGRGGRGVLSCRLPGGGWSSPAYFSMKGGSFGLQIGAQATDFVLLFMNEKAVESLLKSKVTLGGEASVAAGPVGRETGAETDVLMNAQVLSYSRSKGVFGGLELKGTTITAEKAEIEKVYGKDSSASTVLHQSNEKAPPPVQVYPDALKVYSPTKSKAK